MPSIFASSAPPRVAFLFLGETLLIPHLYPILETLAASAPEVAIDVWVSTSVHEGLITGWLAEAALDRLRVRLRRAPGFRDLPGLQRGENPPLPPKLPMLFALLPWLLPVAAIVCAEQTSLWVPKLVPFLRSRFVKTSHGVGSMSARDDSRRRVARLLLVPSEQEKASYTERGLPDEKLVVTGYVKSAFRALALPQRLFDDNKPAIVYSPHWQRHRSSWWAWGRQIVAMRAEQDRYNVILAPHQRLVEKDPEIRAVLDGVAHLAHVHADLDSFAMVDGSYMMAADLYLGDTSSQIVEFLIRPRPCLFLNPDRIDWRATDDHGFWACGEVIDDVSMLLPSLNRAFARHPEYAVVQAGFARNALGDIGPDVPRRAADAVLNLVRRV